jgi:hypothetical protein
MMRNEKGIAGGRLAGEERRALIYSTSWWGLGGGGGIFCYPIGILAADGSGLSMDPSMNHIAIISFPAVVSQCMHCSS